MPIEGFANDGNMVQDLAEFNLDQEIANALQTAPTQGHSAKVLFKKSDLRILLISMQKGSVLKEHHADGTISVQVIKGSVRFTVQGQAHDLRLHNLLTLGASIKHEVEALEDAAILLTIAWPSAEKLESLPHRGYGK
ncbi:MAG: hypothetical protein JSS87_09460 [Acidobacteria bacterium]|nr:hypothetical protein [Acidobacteriota bacterium]